VLIERYHWSLEQVAQIDEADPDFMAELQGFIGGQDDYREKADKDRKQRADADEKAAALRRKVTGK
jgi:hypothetical protein